MTAEPDLLPLPAPDYLLPLGPDHGDISMWSENTIRQIVAHATAAKDAEVEALRAELEWLTAFNDDTCESFNRLSVERTALITRAEQLAEEVEALRAEVEFLRRGIVPRDDDMIVPAKLLDEINASGAEWKDRAERLAEALRAEIPVLRRIAGFGNMSDEMTEGVADRLESALNSTAAQENDDA